MAKPKGSEDGEAKEGGEGAAAAHLAKMARERHRKCIKFMTLLRLMTMTPGELMSFIALGYCKGLIPMFTKHNDLRDDLVASSEMSHHLLSHFAQYANVDLVVAAESNCGYSAEIAKVMSVDQMLTLYNAAVLLYEYSVRFTVFSFIYDEKQIRIESAAHLLMVLYRPDFAAVYNTSDRKELRKWFGKYSRIARMVEGAESFNDQEAYEVGEIVSKINQCQAELRDTRQALLDITQNYSTLRVTDPSIQNGIPELVDPAFFLLADKVALYRAVAGHVNGFSKLNPASMRRPGKQLHELAAKGDDFVAARIAYAAYFAAEMKNADCNNYLTDRQQFKRQLELVNAHIHPVVHMTRVQYAGVPVTDQANLEQIATSEVYRDQLDMPVVIPVTNPMMPLSHSLVLWIEEYLRSAETMPLTASEGALTFLLCLLSNLTRPKGDNRICWIYGLGGVGKTHLLKLISKIFLGDNSLVTTSMTAGVIQAPMSTVANFSATDELAYFGVAAVFTGPASIFAACGNGHVISKHPDVPPLRSSTSADISRRALTRTDESKMYSEASRQAHVFTWPFVTSNNDPAEYDHPLRTRFVEMPFPSSTVELQALALGNKASGVDQPRRSAFVDSIRRVFAASTALNHFALCGLVSTEISLYAQMIALRVIECMVERAPSLTEIMFLTEVKQHGTGEASNAPARADVQEATMKKNTADLVKSIAEQRLGGHKGEDDETILARFQECREEMSKLFNGMLKNTKRPVFCLKDGEAIMNIRAATGIFEMVANLNRLDAILAAVSCNGLGISYSTTDAFAQIVARVDELYVYKPEHVVMAIRFMLNELNPVVPDAFVVLGALLVNLLDEEINKGHDPKPTGNYFVFPKFFTRRVKAPRRNAASKKRAGGNQFASSNNGRGRQGSNRRDQSDDEATIEDAQEEEVEENVPVKDRVNFFQQKLSDASPTTVWGMGTIMMNVAMSSTWGTVAPDGKSIIPFIDYRGFVESNNTSLCISRHIGDVMNAATLAMNDVICSSGKTCTFLTGQATFRDGARVLEGATLARREHATHDEKGESLPEPWDKSTLTLENAFDPIKPADDDNEDEQVAERSEPVGRSDSAGIDANHAIDVSALMSHAENGADDVEMYLAHDSVNQRSRSNQEHGMHSDSRPTGNNSADYSSSAMLRADSLNGLTAQMSNGMTGIGPSELRATSPRDLHRSHSADFRRFDPDLRGVANSASDTAGGCDDDDDQMETEEVVVNLLAPPIPRAKKPLFKLISRSSLTEREELEETKAQSMQRSHQSLNGTNNHAAATTTSSSSGPQGTDRNRAVNGTNNHASSSSSSSVSRVDRNRFSNAVFASDGKSAFSNLRPSLGTSGRDAHVLSNDFPAMDGQLANKLEVEVRRYQQAPSDGVFVAFMKLLDNPATVRGLIDSRSDGTYAIRRPNRKMKEKDQRALELTVRYLQVKQWAAELASGLLAEWHSRLLEMQKEKENRVNEAVDAAIQQDTKFDQAVEIYPASKVVLVARSDANADDTGSIEFPDFNELGKPYPNKLPPLFGAYGKFQELLKSYVAKAGTNSLYAGHKFTGFPLLSLDLVGLVEARKLQRRYGDELYKYFPGYTPRMQDIQTHRYQIQALVEQVGSLSTFDVARADSEGQLYLDQLELMSIHEVHEKVREHPNQFLPIPLTSLKSTKLEGKADSVLRVNLGISDKTGARLYAGQIIDNLVQMLLLLFKYMRFTCTLHGLIEPVVDYSFVLRTAHSLGIVWFREGVRIVAEHVISAEMNIETLTAKVAAELRKYARSVIHSTASSSKTAFVEMYKKDPFQWTRLRTCLNAMSISNNHLTNSMYIPLPGDIPLTKEELAREIGLSASVTKLTGVDRSVDLFVTPLAVFDRNRLAGMCVSCDHTQQEIAFDDNDDEEQKAPRAGKRGGRGGRGRGRGRNDNEPNDGRSLGSRDTGESDEDGRSIDQRSHYSRVSRHSKASRQSRHNRRRSARSRSSSSSRSESSRGSLDRHARKVAHRSRRESSVSSRSRSPSRDKSTRDVLEQLAASTPAASQMPSQVERRDDVNMEMTTLVHPIESSQRPSESKRAIENSQRHSEGKRADDRSLHNERRGRHRHDNRRHSRDDHSDTSSVRDDIRSLASGMSASNIRSRRVRLKKYIREWTTPGANQTNRKLSTIQKLQRKLQNDSVIGQPWLTWKRGMPCPVDE